MNLAIHLDRDISISLQDQLFEQLRQLILTGRLKPNTRVVATRFLAEQAGVSRTTVLLAYERLISEGYLETLPAVGTFVSATPPEQPKPKSACGSASPVARQAALHPCTFAAALATRDQISDGVIDFSPSRSDTSHLLPEKVWLQGIRDAFEREPGGLGRPSRPPAP